ncbi:MAG: SpoVR family protein [Bacteroidales bacterium]|nr:SpoVR family protein [Bacteroidales bacterium]
MELISQKSKKIMEECKERAIDAGLSFSSETLEYIVTNRDMIRLSPKVMIPTLYDYWVNDVEVLKEEGRYKLFPSNPYETVINSRPPISFYNDNNPDWLNIMIFYHVLAHIDFFQNNIMFENTWNDDFVGMALADKRLIESLRADHGRWVDYCIEFGRSIDNIIGYFKTLPKRNLKPQEEPPEKINFFINVFLQEIENATTIDIMRFIERYNMLVAEHKEKAENIFFSEIKSTFPEFEAKYEQYDKNLIKDADILEFIINYSPFLNKKENEWIKSVLIVIRNTSLYFSPQIRTKILNEGWASYWHNKLFIGDPRIKGYESAYAKINAGVTSLNRVGLNPYAIGLRLFEYIKELGDKGKMSYDFQKLLNAEERQEFDNKVFKGDETIFKVREIFSDFNFINTFVEQDFIEKHDLFVVGKRLNQERGTYEYYVKSRKAEDYKNMLIDSLYHPPYIVLDKDKTGDNQIYIKHIFEEKQLYKPYINDTLVAIGFLWGGEVKLETTEIFAERDNEGLVKGYRYEKVLYSYKDRKISKTKI